MRNLGEDILVKINFEAFLRERGKIVPGSHREGHNIFTTVGRDWISHLVAWKALGATPADRPYTNRRVRWISIGTGAALEDPSVVVLDNPVPYQTGEYLAPIQDVEFPTTTSVRFIREFASNEISLNPTDQIEVQEAGLFADVYDLQNGYTDALDDDEPFDTGESTTLDTTQDDNAPIAYKAFGALTKTVDFALEIRWTFKF